MKLLLSGSDKNSHTVASFFTRHFDPSINWQFLRFHDEFTEMTAGKVNRALFRLFPGLFTSKTNASFVRQVKEFRPSVVLVFKGMEITKESLKELRTMGVKTVNYNFDHPFKFFSTGTGNQAVADAIPYYDAHITYSTVIAKELEDEYHIKARVLPFGFALTPDEFAEVIRDEEPEIRKACFVGNPDHLRIKWITELTKRGVSLDLYGFGWERYFADDHQITIFPPQKKYSYWKDPLDFWRVLRRYRVQLNFLRPHNEGSHNLRSFEIPGAGGILLTPDSLEQRQFFQPDNELFLYHDIDSCIDRINFILALSEERAGEIRAAARKRSVSGGYSYQDRTGQLIKILESL